ncbi:glycosyltransferase family 4 protein [Chryseobacterium aquaticum]|uniref:Glycosyl transferase family 1 domain-containing protein n=2 Tax=Chryseobacterium aquaticum TaxID=452084 RepID=A0A117KCY0_9FLAO|nr:glycosyltransferase family 4 protein [Chryseobacterium aquaticum]KQK27503.1 hypothetical protein AR438_00170 [Chryseobacterium aquaticum]KUJ58258.1 hypothetical protein AR686_00155 [Chryseobacterium aquaticum subsp. greenlandense]
MKAVFLIIDYVPHQELTIRKLAEENDFEILAYHVAKFNKSVPIIHNFKTSLYTDSSKENIFKSIIQFKPDIVVVAGWMIKEYVWIAKKLRSSLNVPIVSYSDTQWYGTIKQRVNALISPFHVKKAFSHIWVAGLYQFEYARKLGFKKENIILNSLTADVDLFKKINLENKQKNYPKNFLYIGRFSSEKGLDILISAWNTITDKNGWTLTLIGDGVLKNKFSNLDNIIVKDYMSQKELLKEIENSGCFVLPSLVEPWALVLHEAAISGLPIICTNVCGAAPHFIINKYNGYLIKPSIVSDMRNALENIIQLNDQKLYTFSLRSRELGLRITPETSINSLKQLLK